MATLTARTGTHLVVVLVSGVLLSGVLVMQALAAPGSPLLQDIAQGKPSEQSSTEFGGTPDRAVDGDTNGDHFADSVTHTSNGPGEWWQVDLGGTFDIREIVIWNRTDCCAERLHDVLVLVSADPFPPTAVSEPTGWSAVIPGVADQETRIPVEVRGRYVRVQQTVAEYLSLAEVEVWSSLGPVPSPMPTPSPTPAPTPTSSATGATGGVWTLVAGSPRHESTKGSKDSRYAETFGGGAGSASISISIQPPDPHDPPAIRSDSFLWTHPAATLRPGDRVVMPLAITEQANSGFGYYASGLFARFTRPGQPCGIVRAGDIDVGIVMIGSLMDPPPPPSGEFIVPAPAPGFSGPETSQQMQLQVCANVYQSQTASYYVYEWKPAAATAPSGPKASPTATPPTRAKLVVRVAAPERVQADIGGVASGIPYLIRVTNQGDVPATDVTLAWKASFASDLDSTLRLVRVPNGWICGPTSDVIVEHDSLYENGVRLSVAGHGGVACSSGSLAPGASAALELTLEAPVAKVPVSAVVTASGTCGATGTCEARWDGMTKTVDGRAKLAVEITTPAQVKDGAPLVLTVVVTNVGDGPAGRVRFSLAGELVRLAFSLPEALGWQLPGGWSCKTVPNGDEVVVMPPSEPGGRPVLEDVFVPTCVKERLAPGESATAALTARLTPGGAAGDPPQVFRTTVFASGDCGDDVACEDVSAVTDTTIVHPARPRPSP